MKRAIMWVLAAVLLLQMGMVSAAAQTTDILNIQFQNTVAVAEENLSLSGYGDKDGGYATSTVGGRLYASVSGTDLRKLEWSKGEYGEEGLQPVMTGGTKNPWGNGAYLEVRVSTVGYDQISFSAHLGATNKGPRDYKLQYSVDGTTFRDVAGATFRVTTNKTMFAAFENVALPEEIADREQVIIRIAVASNMLVNGTAGLIGSTGGETAINQVSVKGVRRTTTTASTQVTTAKPTTTTQAETPVAGVTTTAAIAGTTSTIPSVDKAETPSSANTADDSVALAAWMVALAAFTTVMVCYIKRIKA